MLETRWQPVVCRDAYSCFRRCRVRPGLQGRERGNNRAKQSGSLCHGGSRMKQLHRNSFFVLSHPPLLFTEIGRRVEQSYLTRTHVCTHFRCIGVMFIQQWRLGEWGKRDSELFEIWREKKWRELIDHFFSKRQIRACAKNSAVCIHARRKSQENTSCWARCELFRGRRTQEICMGAGGARNHERIRARET